MNNIYHESVIFVGTVLGSNGMKILKERVISETLLRDTKNYLKLTFMGTRLQ